MSCITAPLDIVVNKQTEKLCKLKCSYQFTYQTTSLQIQNEGSFLVMNTDETATPPVIYNDNPYTIVACALLTPSMHTFAGKNADAELIIMHQKVNSQKYLFVCVPIKSSSTSTDDSATYFDLIMAEVAQTAPASGQNTIFVNNTFSLKSMVPMAPYYSYTGSHPFFTGDICPSILDNETSYEPFMNMDYIVFHIDDAITMSPQALRILKQVIPTKFPFVTVPESQNPKGLFFNPNGPVPAVKGEIYIDCRPTGADGEILVTARQDSGGFLNNATLKKIWNYTFMKIIIGALVMLLIWRMAMKAITGIAANSSRMNGGGASGAGASGAGAGASGAGASVRLKK